MIAVIGTAQVLQCGPSYLTATPLATNIEAPGSGPHGALEVDVVFTSGLSGTHRVGVGVDGLNAGFITDDGGLGGSVFLSVVFASSYPLDVLPIPETLVPCAGWIAASISGYSQAVKAMIFSMGEAFSDRDDTFYVQMDSTSEFSNARYRWVYVYNCDELSEVFTDGFQDATSVFFNLNVDEPDKAEVQLRGIFSEVPSSIWLDRTGSCINLSGGGTDCYPSGYNIRLGSPASGSISGRVKSGSFALHDINASFDGLTHFGVYWRTESSPFAELDVGFANPGDIMNVSALAGYGGVGTDVSIQARMLSDRRVSFDNFVSGPAWGNNWTLSPGRCGKTMFVPWPGVGNLLWECNVSDSTLSPTCSDDSALRLYEHDNYDGGCKAFRLDDANFTNDELRAGLTLNDQVSSLKIPCGWMARLFDKVDFDGNYADFQSTHTLRDIRNGSAGEVPSLSWNDRASSVKWIHVGCSVS